MSNEEAAVSDKAEEMRALKQQRTSMKRSISNMKTKLERETDSIDSTVLSCRLQILEMYFKQICHIQSKIESQDGEDTSRTDFEELYIIVKSKIMSMLNNNKRHGTTDFSFNDETNSPASFHHNRLPKLKLPKFDGKYADYTRFMDSFKNLVDDDATIPTIEKFNYLLNCLGGPALAVIESFQISEENYGKALARLKERYDNKVLIFLDHITSLFGISAMKRSDSISLRNIIDTVSALRSSLLSLGTAEDAMNAILIHIVQSKLDNESKSYYDEKQSFTSIPSWNDCSKILERRCLFLESNKKAPEGATREPKLQFPKRTAHTCVTAKSVCSFCNNTEHNLANCSSFAATPVSKRFDFAKRTAHCLNCLRKGHTVSKCLSLARCRVCRKPHHTLLHIYNTSNAENDSIPSTGGVSSSTQADNAKLVLISRAAKKALIPTAVVLVEDIYGTMQPVRAILDSGSEINFITEEVAKRLQLEFKRTTQNISGISGLSTSLKHFVVATIKSRFTSFERSSSFAVTKHITSNQPGESIDISSWKLPEGILLADPEFHTSQRIDMLISAELFFDILLKGKISLGPELPYLSNTEFGWIVGGKFSSRNKVYSSACNLTTKEDAASLEDLLTRFWQIEEVSQSTALRSQDEIQCEQHFTTNVKILDDGRLQVKLPFKKSPNMLGLSYVSARKRFLSVERKLQRDVNLKHMYTGFMREYAELGHMSVASTVDFNEPHYIIPHHCVLRPQSATTKIRVVFDASARTSSNHSLNDILFVGPTLQEQLAVTLLNFRLHKFALIADISKMYRQFVVHKEDRQFQLILWRNQPQDTLQLYSLNTVTYGMSCSPFLAVRCLLHIADLNCTEYAVGARALREDLYVDDLLTGAHSKEELHRKRQEVIKILQLHGLTLAKWNSNHKEFLSDTEDVIPIEDLEQDITKALGIGWQPKEDLFCYNYTPPQSNIATKRTALSVIARLYDVLGLLSPIIVRCKILLQEMWLQHLEWDEPLSGKLKESLHQIQSDLTNIRSITVPRYVGATPELSSEAEVHGFADASQRAYGCCLYLRVRNNEKFTTHLLIAKSRVAPVRAQSLPRLELCAALCLSRTWQMVKHKVEPFVNKVYFWSDSRVVLQWLVMHSSTLTCFVANRVSELQEQTQAITWLHVPSQHNPADVVSRGCSAAELCNTIWFSGPKFLESDSSSWPQQPAENPHSSSSLELRKSTTFVCSKIPHNTVVDNVITKNSSFYKILRILAYVFRIFNRVPSSKSISVSEILHIPAPELQHTFIRIIAHIQRTEFNVELNYLRSSKTLKPALQCLTPFIDTIPIGSTVVEVIRVGGRLLNADLAYEAKHPLLLPNNHRFAWLYAEHLHRNNLHAGAKVLVSLLRQRVWIVNARNLARKVVQGCVHCYHYKPKLLGQVMGNLPADRLLAQRPFFVSGVDFCGPFATSWKIRGKGPYKTYAAIFVCFATKAIHTELVTDLTTNAFLLCLKRFISRSGLPKRLYCDNATNFVGASNQLREIQRHLLNPKVVDEVLTFCSQTGFEFCFIPPRAPHFGGLWEAAVKSAKQLLIKNISQASLTYEELQTILIEVEAILNSRPLAATDTDPNDGEAITPAHFLIGSQISSIPERAIEDQHISYLTRWQRLTYLKQRFWKLWSRDYIHNLQQKAKWRHPHPNIQIGQLVIVHDDNTPPQQWPLARISHITKGSDGKVRVVTLKTTRGEMTRPIHKLAPLPARHDC